MDCKYFRIEALSFLNGVACLNTSFIFELKQLTSSSYGNTFKLLAEIIDSISKKIDDFTERYLEFNEDNVCEFVKELKQYYSHYIDMLLHSSPSRCYSDSTYIMDSLKTINLVTKSKIKELNDLIE